MSDADFIGPLPVDTSSAGQDWLLPLWQQPSYAGQFPEGTFTSILPEPAPRPSQSWLTSLSQPFVNFGQNLFETSQKATVATAEKLPELLWEKFVGPKLRRRVVDEGAGVTVTHTQPPHAGGEPAKLIQTLIPQGGLTGRVPTLGMAGAKDTNTVLWIGAGLAVLYLFIGRK